VQSRGSSAGANSDPRTAASFAANHSAIPGAITSTPRGTDVRERITDLGWLDAPEGVRQESQTYEAVSLDTLPSFVTEIGAETATALHLRALRIEPAAPCASRTST
jgi:hypothetical protein